MRYLVRADITRFFPSVYSHSIPWALFGKSVAKRMHAAGTLGGTWQDDLDKLSRGITNNQTIGLPIGPDTSRLLAEVILGAVDEDLSAGFRGIRGMRFIDDYELATYTRSEADGVLGRLQALLSEFELELNPSKTGVFELPFELDSLWESQLRTYIFRGGHPVAQRSDLTAYFGTVFSVCKQHPDEGSIKYAISRLRSIRVHRDNWRFYENILQHCVAVEPSCLPQVSQELERYRTKGMLPQKARWSRILNRVICDALPLGHSSEAAWAMWLLWQVGARLLQRSAKVVGATSDSISALMGLALADRGLADSKHMTGIRRFASASHLHSPEWLVCYEGNARGWLGAGGAARIGADANFHFLESNAVRFLDTAVTVPSPSGAGSADDEDEYEF